MGYEYEPLNKSDIPEIIMGGMGVAVSDWRIARAVAAEGGLGIISGTAIGLVLAARLQDGDPGGEMRHALSKFPDQDIAKEILKTYYQEGGLAEGQPYINTPKFTNEPSDLAEKLNILGAFAEVTLAKEHGGLGQIGINLLTKIQTPIPSALYGAMLADVDVVAMGAGIPYQIPNTLNLLSKGEPVVYALEVSGAEQGEYSVIFDPRKYEKLKDLELKRPQFLAIISSTILAKGLMRGDFNPDGFVVEGPNAGGHTAPARGNEFDALGQPIFGHKDEVDIKQLADLGLPYWLAGGFGNSDSLLASREQGANGIQVGSAFALCEESGIDKTIKQQMINRVLDGACIKIFTDPNASPSGYPFKVAQLPGTLSEKQVYDKRKRICDRGYLSQPYKKSDGTLGWRCPAEPVESYLKKGGTLEETLGRVCLCNGLPATVGKTQIRENGEYVEPPIVTMGDDVNFVIRALNIFANKQSGYAASDVMQYLKSGVAAKHNISTDILL